MTLHPRFYNCEACGKGQCFWVPYPAPTEIILNSGGCQYCTTPRNHFMLEG